MARSGIQVGDKAPDFTLPKQDGTPVSLAELLSKGAVVLYFYPKDDTPGCTVEACSFRDAYEDFKDAGAEVVGISSDSAGDHRAFADKHRLPFTLVADEGGKVRKLYGVPGNLLGLLPGRVTYVIDPGGVVRHVFDSQMNPAKHVREALDVLKTLKR
jgi:thioredoxin-dependent peroxiredoxin